MLATKTWPYFGTRPNAEPDQPYHARGWLLSAACAARWPPVREAGPRAARAGPRCGAWSAMTTGTGRTVDPLPDAGLRVRLPPLGRPGRGRRRPSGLLGRTSVLGQPRACRRRLPALAHTSALSDSHADPNAPTANYGTGGPATAAGTARVPATGDRSRGPTRRQPWASTGMPRVPARVPHVPRTTGVAAAESTRAPGRWRPSRDWPGDGTGAGPQAVARAAPRRRHGRRAAGDRSGHKRLGVPKPVA